MSTFVTSRNAVAGLIAATLAATAIPATAAPLAPATAGGFTAGSTLPIVQVRKGRNAAAIAAIAGITALGVGAAIASRNNGYYGGGYYDDPGYAYGAPAYGYGAPVVVEEPSYGYGGYHAAPVYAAPRYYEEPIVTYDRRPITRHHAGGPGKRSMDSFRDAYR